MAAPLEQAPAPPLEELPQHVDIPPPDGPPSAEVPTVAVPADPAVAGPQPGDPAPPPQAEGKSKKKKLDVAKTGGGMAGGLVGKTLGAAGGPVGSIAGGMVGNTLGKATVSVARKVLGGDKKKKDKAEVEVAEAPPATDVAATEPAPIATAPD
ncbi:hypothetical protein [Phenylobacterium sp. J367]|uniref:hypothetical protein n=1 Tax=Phenylobacterium sp. J367 TaxID=2898435 RepID=UPI0021518DC5|nr:hypothetical protein [Phenylobacterium sp. J367]MCR5879112.1 hypothetical protein [Phenylobacterium sp. J367]